METPTPNKIILICLGRRLGADNKLFYTYAVEGGDKNMHFDKKIGSSQVGARVEVTPTDNGVKGPYKFIDYVNNQTMIDDNVVRDASAYDNYMLTKEANKKQTSKSYTQAIADLRRFYKDLPSMQRQAFVTRIITEIVK